MSQKTFFPLAAPQVLIEKCGRARAPERVKNKDGNQSTKRDNEWSGC